MGKFILTNKAVEDLGDIWNYTLDRWSEQQADKHYQNLLDACQEAADDPRLGKKYEGIRSELNGVQVMKRVLLFRIVDRDNIETSRILHERMDLKGRI